MLNSLYIKNFRSLHDFEAEKLGRVNLIVGNNNSGKSTVLEALRIFAGNANRSLLEEISAEHDETPRFPEKDMGEAPDSQSLPFENFFYGRQFPSDAETAIVIGESLSDPDALRIRYGLLKEVENTVTNDDGREELRIIRKEVLPTDLMAGDEILSRALFITKSGRNYRLRFDSNAARIRASFNEIGSQLPCAFVPTDLVSSTELAEAWDSIVLTEREDTVYSALKIIEPSFEALAFVNEEEESPKYKRTQARVPKVRLRGSRRPVPLNSMGDGMSRILQLVLRLFSAKDGFLLIDEFENGLHYSIQSEVWSLLFELATRLNIQIFATTHSRDCIESFAKVALENANVEGILLRVGISVRNIDRGRVIATVFDESELDGITQAEMEVR